MDAKNIKPIVWMGNTLKNLREFPEPVKDSVGYALHVVQGGGHPKNAKPLRGFKPQILEIVSDFNSDTYRTVYSVKIDDTVYVLHCFQKKSKTGIKTPKYELDVIKQRLIEAQTLSRLK